jgi:hypothetical protein
MFLQSLIYNKRWLLSPPETLFRIKPSFRTAHETSYTSLLSYHSTQEVRGMNFYTESVSIFTAICACFCNISAVTLQMWKPMHPSSSFK